MVEPSHREMRRQDYRDWSVEGLRYSCCVELLHRESVKLDSQDYFVVVRAVVVECLEQFRVNLAAVVQEYWVIGVEPG